MKTQRPFIEPYAEVLHDVKTIHDGVAMSVETVGEIADNRPFLIFHAEEKIEHIVREMNKHRQGAVGIIDTNADGILVGLLTERDVLRKIFGTHEETALQHDVRQQQLSIYPGSLVAQDVMTQSPICLVDSMPVDKALEKIKYYGFRYMPVVKKDDESVITGIVSERELFWHAQEKFNRTIRTQSNLLSYFIHEPYGAGSTAETVV